MTTSPRGELATIDGRQAIVHTRDLAHPVERVWAAISTPAGLAAWFPCRVDGDLTTAGARLTFTFVSPAGEPDDVTHGTVLECAPPRTLRFTWEGDELRLTLEPTATGSRLVLENLVADGAAPSLARVSAGWHVCLDELATDLETGRGVAPGAEPTERFREIYDQYVAAGFPHDDGVPGAD